MTGSVTTVVLLTPPGRGAVASVLVEGAQAAELVTGHFFPASGLPLSEQSLGKIVFGRWGGPDGEEVVVCRRSLDRVEVHGHGGVAAPTAIVTSLVASGCRETDWQTYLSNQLCDSNQAEARVALAQARTERTADILLTQYHGTLSRAVQQVIELMDQGEYGQATDRLQELMAWAPLGRHLVEPWQVVMAGSPNVGKSSLMNALVGYERTIVQDQPGTTRDVVTASTAMDGWPVELADTAGLRGATSEIEAAGIERAQSSQAAADAVVLVFDASQPWSGRDQELIAAYPDAIVVHNKIDLTDGASPLPGAGHSTSALSGQGISELIGAIIDKLVPNAPPPNTAIPFLPRHWESIQAALVQLAGHTPECASSSLRELLG